MKTNILPMTEIVHVVPPFSIIALKVFDRLCNDLGKIITGKRHIYTQPMNDIQYILGHL